MLVLVLIYQCISISKADCCLSSTLHKSRSKYLLLSMSVSSSLYLLVYISASLSIYLSCCHTLTIFTSLLILFYFSFFFFFLISDVIWPKIFPCKCEQKYIFSYDLHVFKKRWKKPSAVTAKKRGKNYPVPNGCLLAQVLFRHLFLWQGEKWCISEALFFFSWPLFSPLSPLDSFP